MFQKTSPARWATAPTCYSTVPYVSSGLAADVAQTKGSSTNAFFNHTLSFWRWRSYNASIRYMQNLNELEHRIPADIEGQEEKHKLKPISRKNNKLPSKCRN